MISMNKLHSVILFTVNTGILEKRGNAIKKNRLGTIQKP